MGDGAGKAGESGVKKRPRGRPKVKEASKRTERLCTALTPAEVAVIDAARGAMDRSTWLRWVALDAAKRPLPSAAVADWDWDLDAPK